jgi:hypothetical protein
MRAAIIIAALAAAQPAEACHRYSRWLYPYAQRCGVRTALIVDRSWYVEVVLPDERAAAIEVLKKELAIRALTQ